jgi:hypothetical protein
MHSTAGIRMTNDALLSKNVLRCTAGIRMTNDALQELERPRKIAESKKESTKILERA